MPPREVVVVALFESCRTLFADGADNVGTHFRGTNLVLDDGLQVLAWCGALSYGAEGYSVVQDS